MIVPIKIGGRVLGVLSVQSAHENAYTDNDRELLEAISEQAALAVENLRNLRASTQRAADLNLLVEVATAVSSELDLRRVFAKIHSQVRRVIDAPLFYVALPSDEGDTVRLEYLVEGDRVFPATTHATSGTIVGQVIKTGVPVLVHNVYERDRLTTRQIGEGPTSVQSVAAVPMRARGRVIGALSVQSYEANAYTDRHLELLQAIAKQSAIAVQNATLYEQARVLADNDALTGLPHHRTLQERLSAELKRAHRSYGKLAVLMMDLDNFKVFNDSYGHQAGDRALKHVARLLRQVARENDIVGRYGGDEFFAILPDADRRAAEAFASRVASELARRPVSLGAGKDVPLVMSLGCAEYPKDGQRGDELVAVADAELYEKKRGGEPSIGPRIQTTALLAGNLEQFSSLISALTNSSRFMREHVYHMNALAVVYAEFAGLAEGASERETLVRAATLIDLGMLALPSGLLFKPGKVEHQEYDIVKTHARLGYDMLRLMEGCEDVAAAILHHHERYDGSGYPDGLKGTAIPELSRVLAVLDAYTAMTSARPFRRAFSADDAVQELRTEAGSQFDPTVVSTLLKALKK
jgi:diguanylate cyclase (GGDEF)-like protein